MPTFPEIIVIVLLAIAIPWGLGLFLIKRSERERRKFKRVPDLDEAHLVVLVEKIMDLPAADRSELRVIVEEMLKQRRQADTKGTGHDGH